MVQTVLGPVQPEEIGFVLPHEHILFDLFKGKAVAEDLRHYLSGWLPPELETGEPVATARRRWNQEITLANRAESYRDWWYYGPSGGLDSVQDAVEELHQYRAIGGGCIVEVSSIGTGRDPFGYRSVSAQTGVHIVMGASYYTQPYHPLTIANWSEDEVFEAIVTDITRGVKGVKPGIIGEVGLSWPVHPEEEKVLRASTRASTETGLSITIHPGLSQEAPMHAWKIIEEVGGSPDRTVMGHLDNRFFSDEEFCEFAKTGVYLEQDIFGKEEASFYQHSAHDWPNDTHRLNRWRTLADAGYSDRLLMSHDIATKHRLIKYGSFGYLHIPVNVVRLMNIKGFTQDEVDLFTVKNPARMLTIA